MNFKNWIESNVNFKAFTLAEVLITLMVIGMLAMVTLPSLIKSWEKQALKTQLKQTYSELLQVNQLFIAQEGINMYEYAVSMGAGSNNTRELAIKLENDYFKTFNEAKPAAYGLNLAKNNLKTLNENTIAHSQFDDGYFRDNRGRDLYFEFSAPYVSIDVNGVDKKPNKWGHDVFSFYLRATGIIEPMKSSSCSFSSTSVYNGNGCTYYAINNISPDDATKTYWGDFLQ